MSIKKLVAIKEILNFFLSCPKLLHLSLLAKYLVASLVDSGALFINSCVAGLRGGYGKATSNSPRVPNDCIILDN